MEFLFSGEIVKSCLQVLDEPGIKGVVHFCSPHSDGSNLVLKTAFDGYVCICHCSHRFLMCLFNDLLMLFGFFIWIAEHPARADKSAVSAINRLLQMSRLCC